MIDSLFGIKKSGTTIGREVLAGLTTFMVMAYIIFVNPTILSFTGIKALRGWDPVLCRPWPQPVWPQESCRS